MVRRNKFFEVFWGFQGRGWIFYNIWNGGLGYLSIYGKNDFSYLKDLRVVGNGYFVIFILLVFGMRI